MCTSRPNPDQSSNNRGENTPPPPRQENQQGQQRNMDYWEQEAHLQNQLYPDLQDLMDAVMRMTENAGGNNGQNAQQEAPSTDESRNNNVWSFDAIMRKIFGALQEQRQQQNGAEMAAPSAPPPATDDGFVPPPSAPPADDNPQPYRRQRHPGCCLHDGDQPHEQHHNRNDVPSPSTQRNGNFNNQNRWNHWDRSYGHHRQNHRYQGAFARMFDGRCEFDRVGAARFFKLCWLTVVMGPIAWIIFLCLPSHVLATGLVLAGIHSMGYQILPLIVALQAVNLLSCFSCLLPLVSTLALIKMFVFRRPLLDRGYWRNRFGAWNQRFFYE